MVAAVFQTFSKPRSLDGLELVTIIVKISFSGQRETRQDHAGRLSCLTGNTGVKQDARASERKSWRA